MKKIVTIFVLLTLIIGMMGCTSAEEKEIEYKVLTEAEQTELLSDAVEEIRATGGYKILVDENSKYAIIALGERLTGGYNIEIDQVKEKDEQILIQYKEIKPKENEMVTQALTYPYVVLKIESKLGIQVTELQ